MRQIGALWKSKTKNGVEFFSGNIDNTSISGNIRILAFWNDKEHKHSERSPDLEIFLADDRKKKQQK
jgi:uncharacterized protein (DUF736 family)